MSYINVLKPTDSTYTEVNSSGKEGFDDASTTFDQTTTFFDGVSMSVWTEVPRPKQPFGLNRGMTMGLLIPLTIAINDRTGDPWIRVPKPT